MHYASNAVLAKARAMYACHITASEYESLVACKSLNELITKLRRFKRYSSVLEKATATVTADQAEELLKMSIFEQLSVLGRYEVSGGNNFYKYYIVKKDIEQILKFIRLLISERANEYLTELPAFFNKLTELNLIGLSKARNMEELLTVLSGTPYRKIIEPFKSIYKENGVYLRIEAAFNAYRYNVLFGMLETEKSDKKQISEVLNLFFDSEFITSFYRLKKMGVSDEKIFDGYFQNRYSYLTGQQTEKLKNASNEREYMSCLSDTIYGEALKGLDYDDTEKVMDEYVCKKFIKGLRFYTDPAAILICYMCLAENEVMNIIRIVEGIRYAVPADEIYRVLTGIEDKEKE